MSKGRAKDNLNKRVHLIHEKLQSRHKQLTGELQAAKEGRLDIEDLKRLKIELEKPVKLSETLFIQIADCHTSTGTYKGALPKGYQSDVTAITKALSTSITIKNIEEEIQAKRREIIEAFNAKPKQGIQKIKEICAANNNIGAVEEQIANFFHREKGNLDLEAVGDYISGHEAENQAVLKIFTNKIDFAGQSFTQGLRSFLKTFKLPGEAQKIDRLVEIFSTTYFQQNSGGDIANSDAAYILAFQIIMLNTDLHNSNITADRKMDFNGLKRNLGGCNNKADFDENFLLGIYEDIKANPFEFNFVKIAPGYTISSSALSNDSTFNRLNVLMQSSNLKAHHFFPGVGGNIKATISQPSSWLNIFTGYSGTISLSDENSVLATIQVYNPSFLSKWLFGEQPQVVIQPVSKDGKVNPEAINLAAKAAASFKSPVTSVKATYDYEKGDLQSKYDEHKKKINETSNKYLLSSEKLQSLVEEGRFVVRGVRVNQDFNDIDDEIKYLNTTRMDGTYNNVERSGQRGRSASLIVPGVEMALFADVGFVYDADMSTIRAFMFHDSMTSTGHGHDNFYSVLDDKQKFTPFISKQDFMKAYREHSADPQFNHPRYTKYNEIIGNFFPESLTGLVGKNDNFDTKLKLFIAKAHLLNQQNIDLPMTLIVNNKIQIWNPDMNEILNLLKVANKTNLKRSDFKLFEELAHEVGFPWQYNAPPSQNSRLQLFKSEPDIIPGEQLEDKQENSLSKK